jgi:GNAT superfamily N-acetyltransferase
VKHEVKVLTFQAVNSASGSERICLPQNGPRSYARSAETRVRLLIGVSTPHPKARMTISIMLAADADALELAMLRKSVSEDLPRRHGRGHWSHGGSERGVLRDIWTSRVLVARAESRIIATLSLATKKPWAIDVNDFTPVKRSLYLLAMAVAAHAQGRGVGRQLITEAVAVARDCSSQAIRLDAYDASAGAGIFYGKCGFNEAGRVEYRGTPLIYLELLLDSSPRSKGMA